MHITPASLLFGLIVVLIFSAIITSIEGLKFGAIAFGAGVAALLMLWIIDRKGR